MSNSDVILGSQHYVFLEALENAEKQWELQYGVARKHIYRICEEKGIDSKTSNFIENELVSAGYLAHQSAPDDDAPTKSVYYVRFQPKGRAALEQARLNEEQKQSQIVEDERRRKEDKSHDVKLVILASLLGAGLSKVIDLLQWVFSGHY